MSHPPLQRFLGLPEDATDRAVLGLPEQGAVSPAQVSEVLERAVARLERHPAAASDAGLLVRQRLAVAATQLMKHASEAPAPPAPPQAPVAPRAFTKQPEESEPLKLAEAPTAAEPVRVSAAKKETHSAPSGKAPVTPGQGTIAQLTEFDRTVLAILVGSGGWNSASRGRLIGLAAERGLSPQALVRIVAGLAQLLHGGGFEALAGGQRAIEAAILCEPPKKRRHSRTEQAMNQLSAALASEFRGDTAGSRMRLGVIFGIAAIGLIAFFAILLTLESPVSKSARAAAERKAALLAAATTAETENTTARTNPFLEPAPIPERVAVLPVEWPAAPSFHGDARPHAEVLRSLEATNWLDELDILLRKASVPSNAESPRVKRDYARILNSAGRCWPLLDSALRARLLEAFAAPIARTASSALRESLLESIGDQVVAGDPKDALWRQSFAAGLLGQIATSSDQPDEVRTQARAELRNALGRSRQRENAGGFDAAAGRALSRMTPVLLDETHDAGAAMFDAWERWLQAQRAVNRGVDLEAALLDAIDVLLRDARHLQRAGATANLLGRFVSEVNFTARGVDPELVRANLRAWFEDASIPANSLWVLSSLLAQSVDVPWWGAGLVLGPGADGFTRLAFADRVDANWPNSGSDGRTRGVPVPGEHLALLDDLVSQLERDGSAPSGDPLAGLVRLIALGRLSAAAELLEQQEPGDARTMLIDIQTMRDDPWEPSGRPVYLSGDVEKATGADGGFAESFKRIRGDLDERVAMLRTLKQRRSGDLQVVDADALAREALRGSPRELRLLAQDIVAEHFGLGPNITLALLNHVDLAPRNQDTHDFIVRLTAVSLPSLSSDSWRVRARAALVRLSLDTRKSSAHDVGFLSDEYKSLLRQRLAAAGGSPSLAGDRVGDAASALVDIVRARASKRYVSDPLPAPLVELDRRRTVRLRSAIGEPQRLVAELAALFDLASFETAGMRPDLRRSLLEAYASVTAAVSVAPNVLEQLAVLEEAIARMVRLRLDAEGAGRSQT